jgi:hypothetical protein
MVNFYVPNYTKEEFEELDNKVLLLSKEKYSQQNIKFNDYDPTIDTRKIICSISYNDPKVNHIIYDDIENIKLFNEPATGLWYTVLIQYFLLTARIGSNEAQDNLRYFFNISARKDRTALSFLKVNQNKNSGIFLKKGYLTEIVYYLSKKDLTSLGYDFIVQNLLDKFFHVFRKFAENKNIEIKSKDKIMVKLGAAALEAILTFPKTCV